MLEALQVDEGNEGDKVWQTSSVEGVGDEVGKRWLNSRRIARGRHIRTLEGGSNEAT